VTRTLDEAVPDANTRAWLQTLGTEHADQVWRGLHGKIDDLSPRWRELAVEHVEQRTGRILHSGERRVFLHAAANRLQHLHALACVP
jgi:hypothetical protein